MTLRRAGVTFALLFASWCGLDVRAAEAQCTYSVSPTSTSALSTGQSGSISVITGGLCAWTATSAVPWITITGGASMTGLGSTNYTVAPNGTGSPRTGTLTVAGQIVTITQSTGSCSYSVSPTSTSALSTGQSASISVITGGLCAWTATSAVPWITITGGASMTGLGSTNYTVAPNGTGSARTGTLTVAGQIVTITQSTGSCSYDVSPINVSALSTGQSASISVITGGLCAWTATSAVPWITITGGASMTGLGSTNYTVAPNGTGSSRTGTLTVAGQIVTITQSTGSCGYDVSPTSVSALSTGQSASISVITGGLCAWTATSAVPWITITGGASMTGLGSTNYTVAPNGTGSARTGALTVAGQIVTITQSTGSCTYSVSPTSASALSTGQSSSISVTTGGLCAWTATSAVPWITITGGASMTGLGSTNYTVAPNATGSARTGTLTVAGQTVTITQSTGSCTYSVSPTSTSALSTGQSGSISVITGGLCAWTATSAVPWITITGGASMTGLGSANYTVAPNATGSARTGTLTVAGQTVTITQSTGSCSYSVSPTSVSALSTGQSSSISVTTGGLCAWTATSAVPWITITGGASMTGLGSANYTVAPNATGSARTGTLTVAGQIVTISQSTGSCTYSVSPTSMAVPSTGSLIAIAVVTGSSCAWTSTSSVAWIVVNSGASMFGLGSANFTVAATTSPRTGTLTVAGQIISITQGAAQPPASPANLRIISIVY